MGVFTLGTAANAASCAGRTLHANVILTKKSEFRTVETVTRYLAEEWRWDKVESLELGLFEVNEKLTMIC